MENQIMDLINVQESNTSNPLPLLDFLKQNDQDFEWYPTTQEILDCIKSNIRERFHDRFSDNAQPRVSVLDCGAGDGRALKALSNGAEMYAIEKSERLLFEMDEDIYIVGTDFHTNTIIDKKTEVIFSNPPYSEYQEWATKIIREANSTIIYLVIPNRWIDSAPIHDALTIRDCEAKIIGSFDFINAERQARAVVDILAIDLSEGYSEYRGNRDPKTDPFTVWFNEYFSINADQADTSDYSHDLSNKNNLSEKLSQELVDGKNLIQALVNLYNNQMQHLIKNYQAVGDLDYSLLKELGVSVSGLRGGLQQKITGLKSKYWNEFFNNYDRITSRLTNASRDSMLKKLHANMSIDFTESNALAITAWAIKNANGYYDRQLITMFEGMVDQANVTMYKSNLRTWGKEDWRYCYTGRGPEDLSHYGLELRIVLHRHSAIEGGGYGYSFDFENGLHKDVHTYLEDLATIAGNLGFNVRSQSRLKLWKSNKSQEFFTDDNSKLMDVKAFKNGNLHIRFNQLFIRRLNVEFGRLKGWIKNKQQAGEELNIPVEEVEGLFNSNHQISHSSVPQICSGSTIQTFQHR